MPAFIAFGRILFAVLFIVSGAGKLLDISAATETVAAHVTVPSILAPYAQQAEAASGMTTPHMLAILAGLVELVSGILIALNLATRVFAFLLVIFIVLGTLYFHDFWNQSGDAARTNMVQALKNLSLIGALLMLIGMGGRRRANNGVYAEM
jgi:putative oxidoreductase